MGRTGAGAANHLLTLGQRKGGSSCAGDVLRALHQQLERGIKLLFIQRAATVEEIANRIAAVD